MEKVAIVIVTYKRQELLQKLFDSIKLSTLSPWRIVIVDNENSPQTKKIVDSFQTELIAAWGGDERVVYIPMHENTGGSGGFYEGVKRAYELGAEWFWIMDDDVAVEPDGLEKLSKWTAHHEVIQGSRQNFDDTPFYWQYHFIVPLGIPDPIAPSAFGPSGYKVMNTACFEGGLFKRNIIEKIGFPDKRFFIYWDDTMYGYLASKVTNPIIVPDIVLRRTRELNHLNIAHVRKLNSTSDMTRYYIMRNRGFMARYFMTHGDYRPFLFGLGTVLTFVKEIIRIVGVDHSFKKGIPALFRGWLDSRKILRDQEWEPMPPLKK
jgi:GT2 family glycosyltransferase